MKNKLIFLILTIIFVLSGCASNVPVSLEKAKEEETENPIKWVTISCAGDCTLGADESFFGNTLPEEINNQGGDYSWFFRNVLPIFEKDDLTIVNLEGTLTDGGVRQDKTYAFHGKPEYVNILTCGGVNAVTLANNHSFDYGETGLSDTKKILDNSGIDWVENNKTTVKEINGIKVGLIGLSDLNGSASYMLPKTIEQVKNDGAQVIVVQLHWGVEKEINPTERQREIAHTAVDLGADLVIGHHPHVLQGIEKYKGKMIAYSLGNFCFGGNQNPDDKDTMIFQQTFFVEDGTVLPSDIWQIYPCCISSVTERNNYQPTPIFGKDGELIRQKIQTRTNDIGELNVTFADGF